MLFITSCFLKWPFENPFFGAGIDNPQMAWNLGRRLEGRRLLVQSVGATRVVPWTIWAMAIQLRKWEQKPARIGMKHNFLEKEKESIAASESWLLHLGNRSCWCLKLLSTYEQDVIDVGFHRRLGVPMKIRERSRVGHVLFVEYVGELPSKKLVVLVFSINDCSGGPISTNNSWVLLDKPTAERYVHGWR